MTDTIFRNEQSAAEQMEITSMLPVAALVLTAKSDPKQALLIQGSIALAGAKAMDRVLEQPEEKPVTVDTPPPQSSSYDVYYGDEVSRLINEAADARKAAAEQQEAHFRALGINWPVDPNFKFPFDVNNVPPNFKGIMERIRLMMSAINTNKRNPNLMTGFMIFMINVQKTVSPQMMAQLRPELDKLAKISGFGKSFPQMMISMLRESFFYQQGGGADACRQGMAALRSLLEGVGGKGNPFIDQLLYWTKNYGSDVDDFIRAHTKNGMPDLTSELYWWKAQGDMGKFCKTNYTGGGVARQLLMDLLDHLIKNFKKNQAILVQVLMSTVGGHMNSSIQELGAYGELSKSLGGLTQIDADLNSMMQGPMDAKKAQEFFDKLRKFMAQVDFQDSFFGNTPASVHRLYEDICRLKIDDKTTIGQMLDPKRAGGPDWGKIAAAINKYQPSADDKDPKPKPEFTQIMGDLKALDTSIESQTSVIQTMQGKLQTQVNSDKNLFDDIINKQYSQGWLHTLVANQQRASS